MRKPILYIFSLLFCCQPGFASLPNYGTQQPTPAETRAAQEVTNLFLSKLEATGDLASLFSELYVGDFIDRYIKQQRKHLLAGQTSQPIFFAPGLEYQPQLLEQVSPDEWRRLYAATGNLIYFGFVTGLNRSAKDLVSGKEPDEKILKNLYPDRIVELFGSHPILKNFIERQERRPIETAAEMRSVIATLEQAMTFLRTGEAKKAYQLSADSKKLMEMLKQALTDEAAVEVVEEEFFGYPQGTRLLYVPTPIMLQLIIVPTAGKYRVVWTEPGPGK